jgi:hypothetical protein
LRFFGCGKNPHEPNPQSWVSSINKQNSQKLIKIYFAMSNDGVPESWKETKGSGFKQASDNFKSPLRQTLYAAYMSCPNN